MFSQSIEIAFKNLLKETLPGSPFESIYLLAVNKDLAALKELVGRVKDSNVHHGIYTPCSLHALEGHDETVEWLIENTFGEVLHYEMLNEAARGYAMRQDHEKVEEFSERGASPDVILEGYALAGNVDKAKEWTGRGAKKHFAGKGYALRGDDQQVEVFMKDIKVNNILAKNYILLGYAIRGDEKKVEEWLERGATIHFGVRGYAIGLEPKKAEKLLFRSKAFDFIDMGYREGGHFSNPAATLYILALTDQLELRERLAMRTGREEGAEALLTQANQLNCLTTSYQLEFHQALAVSSLQCRMWLIEGAKLANNSLPIEIIDLISAYAFSLKWEEISHIRSKMNEILHNIRVKIDFRSHHKNPLIKTLNDHTGMARFFSANRKKAMQLLPQVKATKSKEELRGLLNKQEQDDFYLTVLNQYNQRVT